MEACLLIEQKIWWSIFFDFVYFEYKLNYWITSFFKLVNLFGMNFVFGSQKSIISVNQRYIVFISFVCNFNAYSELQVQLQVTKWIPSLNRTKDFFFTRRMVTRRRSHYNNHGLWQFNWYFYCIDKDVVYRIVMTQRNFFRERLTVSGGIYSSKR